jgi:hypothetical protein
MQATRTFFIGLSANPCIGAPVVPKSFSGLFAQPAAIATAPIHAADVKNSLLVFMVVLSPVLILVLLIAQPLPDEKHQARRWCVCDGRALGDIEHECPAPRLARKGKRTLRHLDRPGKAFEIAREDKRSGACLLKTQITEHREIRSTAQWPLTGGVHRLDRSRLRPKVNRDVRTVRRGAGRACRDRR